MEFVGFMTIMVVGGLGGAMVREYSQSPEFVTLLTSYSPWLGAHSMHIGWLAIFIVLMTTAYIPYRLKMSDIGKDEDESSLGSLGNIIGGAGLIYSLLFLVIPAIGYLLGMGWFGAKALFGQ